MEPFNTQPHTEKVHEVMHGLEGWLAPLFEQAPHIPEKGRKVLTDIAPWIALIFGALGLVGILAGGFMVAVATVVSGGFALFFLLGSFLPMLAAGIASVLMLLSFSGLRAMKKSGWNLMFYSEVVNVAGGVLGILSGQVSMLLGTLIGAIIGFWILFEVRSFYHS